MQSEIETLTADIEKVRHQINEHQQTTDESDRNARRLSMFPFGVMALEVLFMGLVDSDMLLFMLIVAPTYALMMCPFLLIAFKSIDWLFADTKEK